MSQNNLKEKIRKKTAKVAVIGLGYVGLPLALEFCKAGYTVFGVEISRKKLKQLAAGDSYVLNVPGRDIVKYCKSGQLKLSSSFEVIKDADTVSIAVPTPLRKTKDPDISYIVSAVESCRPYLHKNMLIVLESTTYPGTTRELIAHEIEQLGFKIGRDLHIAFSPERVDPGNQFYDTKNTPKVIGGITPKCTQMAKLLYEQVIDQIIPVGSTEEAEMVKLLENTFRAVNIGLVNELTLMCDRMGIDIWNIIDAAATKPFGFMPFYPGPGLGGHCIPLDPVYLSWKAKTYNFYNRFIELASDINGNMPRFTVNKLARILNKRKKTINGSKILLLGITYKSNVNDLRESPGLEIYEMLKEEGAKVSYHDPYAPSFTDAQGRSVNSLKLSASVLKTADCVVVVTAHDQYDLKLILQNARLILDTRNQFKALKSKKIVKL
ncbi:MAG: nucleotide sugar dehydrogenase [Candidatus Margulisiibacteriota bacterium]|jgi:UDP-N-acetyl-D-glucosamine dehydrogenase